MFPSGGAGLGGGFQLALLRPAPRVSTLTGADAPALREHKEDIPALVNHFLRTFDRTGRIEEMSSGAFEVLMAYGWPRNVRELRLS